MELEHKAFEQSAQRRPPSLLPKLPSFTQRPNEGLGTRLETQSRNKITISLINLVGHPYSLVPIGPNFESPLQ